MAAPPPPPASTLRQHYRRLAEVDGGGNSPRWLNIGVPVLAITAALGSLYWNVSLRQQLTVQESSVSALERQNQKLSQQLEDTSSELRAESALGAVAPLAATQNAAGATRPLAGSSLGQHANAAPTPSPAAKGSHPIPGVPLTGTSHPPAAVSQGGGAKYAPTAGAHASASSPSAISTNAAYTDPLAQNIATVFNLRKHSRTPVTEFHVSEGAITKPYPDIGIQVRNPDKKHGTYTLVVLYAHSRTELGGKVNQPVVVVRRTDGRLLQLTVLNITGNQIFGYLNETR